MSQPPAPPEDEPAPAPPPPPPEDEPPPLPGPDTLGDTVSIAPDDIFGPGTREIAQRIAGRGYLVRLFGGEIADSVDAILLGTLLDGFGKAGKWSTSALFGKQTAPRVRTTRAGASVVIEFTGPPGEEAFSLEEDRQGVTPTAYSGAWLGRLLALDDPNTVMAQAQRLRHRALLSYARTLEELRQRQIGVDWLTLEDPSRPRYLHASVDQVSNVAETLGRPGGTRERTFTVTGRLIGAQLERKTFELVVSAGELAGRTISGEYAEAAEDDVSPLGRTVDVQIRATEAKYPELPRAPRAKYRLVRVLRERRASTG